MRVVDKKIPLKKKLRPQDVTCFLARHDIANQSRLPFGCQYKYLQVISILSLCEVKHNDEQRQERKDFMSVDGVQC